jgi:hypothetical protein
MEASCDALTGVLYADMAQHHTIPLSQTLPDIQFVGHCPDFFLRDVKGGLAFRVYFSSFMSPPSDTGLSGDFYVLSEPPILFWRDQHWRPWTWQTFVKHPLWNEYVLNFDFQGPTWTLSSGPVEPSFMNSRDAVFQFFKINVKYKSDLGTSLKPILVE